MLEVTGDPEVLTAEDVDDPVLAPNEVLIRVAAAGVNFADVLMRRGAYARPPVLPAVLGNEVAGEVVSADGPFVSGDRVVALPLGGGGYAELVAVNRALVFPLPNHVVFEEAAGLLMTYCTAYLAITRQLRLREGEWLLVQGGGGGLGTAAIQLATQLGVRVVATATSDERLRVARGAGAELVLDRRSDDVAAAVRSATEGAGVHGVIDPLGGPLLEPALSLVRPFGALVAVGEAAGGWPEIQVARLAGRNVGVHGIYLARVFKHAPAELRAAAEAVLELAVQGTLRPCIGGRFALEDAAAAHALIETGGHAGKLVLSVPVR